ncbi:hypothetical protein GCM10029976_039260 [Kribbella albertanoniae]|uniref:Uncharacterized protein n=1 Tax=Kribbella albertanoniae TaxID=1266829 RepID=A0A4R4QAL0_9ACTN|nr:hypothetical protein [Kribbella albertanoniae]TDC32310.1 hypothetical protein E1261_08875 [Kribbella albertanoniae]
MYAVVGVWEMDSAQREAQQSALEGIVAGVSQLPGMVKGYWSDYEDPARSHTFIVFDDRDAAAAFADSVRGNVENQTRSGVRNISVDILAVKATT